MTQLPSWPAGALEMRDDGTGQYCYFTRGTNGGFDVYVKPSVSAKVRFRKHVNTVEEARREMEKFMENF